MIGGLDALLSGFLMFAPHRGLLSTYLTELSCSYKYFPSDEPPDLPNLRILRLHVNHDVFAVLEPTFAWEDDLNESDLEKVIIFTQLGKLLSGLKVFVLKGDCQYASSGEMKATWQKNLLLLEDALRPLVTRARSVESDVSRSDVLGIGQPLYPGSQVLVRTSIGGRGTAYAAKMATAHKQGAREARQSMGSGAVSDVASRQSEEGQPGLATLKPVVQSVSTGTKHFQSTDIPENVKQLQFLLFTHGEEVLDWIRRAKTSMGRGFDGSLRGSGYHGSG